MLGLGILQVDPWGSLPQDTGLDCNWMKRQVPTREENGGKHEYPLRKLALSIVFLLTTSRLFPAQNDSGKFEDLARSAAAARDARDVPRAIALYSKTVQLNPKWPDGWWFLGVLQYGSDEYALARDALTRYIDLTPHAGPATALRGLCEFETGEYTESLQDIQLGLLWGADNQPRNQQILRYHEGMLLTLKGKFESALQSYAVLVHAGTLKPEMLAALGLAGLRTSLLPKDIEPAQQDLFMTAGYAASRVIAGDQNDAKQAFQRLFQRFPTVANAHYLYGYLLFATDLDQALTEFKQELEVSPDNPNAQAMLAWAFLLQSRPSDALPYAKRAADEEAKLPLAQLVVGRSLVETGSLSDGIAHLEMALHLEPDNLETHLALASAYAKSGRREDARRERLLCLQLTKEPTPIAQP